MDLKDDRNHSLLDVEAGEYCQQEESLVNGVVHFGDIDNKARVKTALTVWNWLEYRRCTFG